MILHPESDCYFEAFGEDIRDALKTGECCDVTGFEDHEAAFLEMSKK